MDQSTRKQVVRSLRAAAAKLEGAEDFDDEDPLLARALEYFLNVDDELGENDDPLHELTHALGPKNREMAKYLLARRQDLRGSDVRTLLNDDSGDAFLKKWIADFKSRRP